MFSIVAVELGYEPRHDCKFYEGDYRMEEWLCGEEVSSVMGSKQTIALGIVKSKRGSHLQYSNRYMWCLGIVVTAASVYRTPWLRPWECGVEG